MPAELHFQPPAEMPSGRGMATPTAAVRLVHRASGAVIERLPVDAREILATGEYVLEGQPVDASTEADAPATGDSEKLPPLPKIAHLAAAVLALDADAVRAMQARDSRANAAPIYAARLAELEPPPPPPPPAPAPAPAPGVGEPPAS